MFWVVYGEISWAFTALRCPSSWVRPKMLDSWGWNANTIYFGYRRTAQGGGQTRLGLGVSHGWARPAWARFWKSRSKERDGAEVRVGSH